jgi:hypothetical protein
MTRVVLSLALALAAMLLATAPASAQTCNAPPGTAAVDQYCENAPSASGNGGGGGSQSGATTKPSNSTVRALARAGQGGEELNRYLGTDVASTRVSGRQPNSKPSSSDRAGAKKDRSAATPPNQPSSNPLGAVQSAVNSGSTIGNGFIWALIAIALLIAGMAWVRHRRNSAS